MVDGIHLQMAGLGDVGGHPADGDGPLRRRTTTRGAGRPSQPVGLAADGPHHAADRAHRDPSQSGLGLVIQTQMAVAGQMAGRGDQHRLQALGTGIIQGLGAEGMASRTLGP